MNQDHVSVPRPAYLNDRGPETDVLKLLDKLEDLADGAIEFWHRAWGLILDEFHMLTNKIRASLPDEVRRASRVAGDSDRIVSAARDEAHAPSSVKLTPLRLKWLHTRPAITLPSVPGQESSVNGGVPRVNASCACSLIAARLSGGNC